MLPSCVCSAPKARIFTEKLLRRLALKGHPFVGVTLCWFIFLSFQAAWAMITETESSAVFFCRHEMFSEHCLSRMVAGTWSVCDSDNEQLRCRRLNCTCAVVGDEVPVPLNNREQWDESELFLAALCSRRRLQSSSPTSHCSMEQEAWELFTACDFVNYCQYFDTRQIRGLDEVQDLCKRATSRKSNKQHIRDEHV